MSSFLEGICHWAAGRAVALGRAMLEGLFISGQSLHTEIMSLEGVIFVQEANPMENWYIQANKAVSGVGLEGLGLREFGMPFILFK